MYKSKVGSLFSGIGGIDLGFEQAGFEIAWANDMDASACKTYRHNFPNTHLIEGDVRDVDPRALPDIDVLVAGFPCQPFSIMGYRRGFKDPRGNLFFEISRFIDIKRPRVVLLENVRNLMEHDSGKTFLVIYNTLAQFGYSVKYKVINATDVNIPQNRARIFIVAFLNIEDCDRFTFPEAIPLEATIEDVIDRSIKHDEIYYYDSNSRYFKELNAKIVEKSGIYRIDDSGVATRKWEICPTLKANMGTYHDRVPIIRDDFGIRKLTPMECLAFQGFSKEYIFRGIPLESAYKQCGNTVCVPVIKQIALQVKCLF
ncbi:MAG: DNA (cytosine-5-)-methyltransferase [Ruminococcaceae bacterium]|nr:DNA (cytosine-5-)-methyltransferase [Oscillospiraceae bacterium]